jgi:hypothetical protein
MGITDELREWANDNTEQTMCMLSMPPKHYVHGVLEQLLAIADRIDAEYKKALSGAYADKMDANGWVRLPVDADGEPWHIGDVTESGNTIKAMEIKKHGWCFIGIQNEIDPSLHRHYHAPTIEDVLREFADEMNQNLGMYTGEAIDADEWRDADNKTIAKYAKRLTLAEGEDA